MCVGRLLKPAWVRGHHRQVRVFVINFLSILLLVWIGLFFVKMRDKQEKNLKLT